METWLQILFVLDFCSSLILMKHFATEKNIYFHKWTSVGRKVKKYNLTSFTINVIFIS